MNTVVSPEQADVLQTTPYRPAITILLPFQPKMKLKSELQHMIKKVLDQVERKLTENYPEEMGRIVLQKLMAAINNLNYNTHRNSLAIFVSPIMEKVLYLDVAVEECVFIDRSFDIRAVVHHKKPSKAYLLLQLNGQESKLCLGEGEDLRRIVSNSSNKVLFGKDRIASTATMFSNIQERREFIREKFLQQVDHSLDILLKAYPYPLFITGPAEVLARFQQLTRHQRSIVDWLPGDHADHSMKALQAVIEPVTANWERVQECYLLNQVQAAADENKLAVGMREVWREAMSGRGRLLILERNYQYNPANGNVDEIIFKAIEPNTIFSYKKDPVDDVIEKVLESGGDVLFVRDGLLEKYKHIALVESS